MVIGNFKLLNFSTNLFLLEDSCSGSGCSVWTSTIVLWLWILSVQTGPDCTPVSAVQSMEAQRGQSVQLWQSGLSPFYNSLLCITYNPLYWHAQESKSDLANALYLSSFLSDQSSTSKRSRGVAVRTWGACHRKSSSWFLIQFNV